MDFKYVVDPTSNEPIMLLDTHIGYDETDGEGIDGSLFAKELLSLDTMEKDRIQVWINSIGGQVSEGMKIYTAILKSKTKVDTYVNGIAASIAAVIFQGGRKRIMADYGILLYHDAFGGNPDILPLINEAIATMIARSGLPRYDILKMMKQETFFNADESLKLGLADAIDSSIDFNKKRLVPTMNTMKVYQRECCKVMNKKINGNGNTFCSPLNAHSIMAQIAARHKQ